MTLSEFRARFPEFRTASDTLVESVLAEATARLDERIFGALTDAAVGYLAAHLLATSPFGESQRLEDDKSESTYHKSYLAIRQQVVVRTFVT
ncbi:MAG TPA: DUF4054 domain-containing protein [Vicinamibacterales bacterium]|jgi:hypothetical protein|nr:DUF4054 domain-containing protein [Vicinamibacterales bacterium]